MPELLLNGVRYVAEEGVDEYQVDAIPAAFRLLGIEKRFDNQKVFRVPYNNYAKMGVGWRRMKRDLERGISGMWKSSSETRFADCLYNGLMEHETATGNFADHFRKYINFNGDLYGLTESDYSGSAISVVGSSVFDASADTWGSVDHPSFEGQSVGATTNAATITVAHNSVSSSNQIVIALPQSYESSSPAHPTGVTWAGSAMTKVADSDDSAALNVSIWYKTGGTTGTQNCIATWAGSMDELKLLVVSYLLVNQSTPFGTAVDHAGTGATATMALTTKAGDLGIMFKVHGVGEATAVGSGETERRDDSSPRGFAFYEERATGTSTTLSCTWSTSTSFAATAIPLLGNGAVVVAPDNTVGVRFFDVCHHLDSLFAITNDPDAETDYRLVKSTDGATWTEQTPTNWPTDNWLSTANTRANTWPFNRAVIASDGVNLMVALYDGSAIQVYNSTNDGGTFTASAIATITSGTGPKALHHWVDPYANPTDVGFVLIAAEGAYFIDIANTAARKFYYMGGQTGDGLASAVGDDGNLYVGTHQGQIVQISVNNGQRRILQRGPESHDGLPTEWRGYATYMLSGQTVGGIASPWLWCAYGGNAESKTATILAYDYEASAEQNFAVWHCFHDAQENSVSGMGQNVEILALGLSTESDGVPRLHAAADAAAGSLAFHFEEPLVCHMASEVTGKYVATTYVQFAEDDFGDGHNSVALLVAKMFAAELGSSSEEKIEFHYADETEDWKANDAGDFVDGTPSLTLASGAGVGMKTGKWELVFNRRSGTVTERAIMKDFEVQVDIKQAYLRGFQFNINLAHSARLQGVKVETVISRLETAIKLVTKPKLSYGGTGSLYVDVTRHGQGVTQALGSRVSPTPSRLGGIYPIRCEERIEA